MLVFEEGLLVVKISIWGRLGEVMEFEIIDVCVFGGCKGDWVRCRGFYLNFDIVDFVVQNL